MQPYGREQHIDDRFSEQTEQHWDELSSVFDSPPTAADVFFELGVTLAAFLGFAVAARLLLVALGAV